MKRLLYISIISVAALVASCRQGSERPMITDAEITVADNLHKLRFREGFEDFELHFTANYDWRIKTEGKGFSVYPESGCSGEAAVTVHVSHDSSIDKATETGAFTIFIDNSNASYPVRIEQMPGKSHGKTLIAWFFGTSLNSYLNNNLRCMQSAVNDEFPGDGNSLLIVKQTSATSADIQELYFDTESGECQTITLDTVDLSTDLTGESFGRYLTQTMDYARAESYSAIFLGHSTAWLPDNPIAAVRAYGVVPGFVPSFEKAPGAAETRTIGEYNVMLDIDELAEGLSSTGAKFDCLYFDVCFMASLEAAYQLRDNADWIIGSPCEIMAYGTPYDTNIAAILNGDYDAACKEFFRYYEEDYFYKSACMSAIDCSKLEALADVVRRINATPAAEDFDYTEIQKYEGRTNSGHIFYDAGHYFSRICDDEELLGEFRTALEECIPYSYHTDEFYSVYNARMNNIHHYSGVSVTPDEKCIETMEADNVHKKMLQYYNPSLQQTDWYRDTH